jgi:hypothetical protein
MVDFTKDVMGGQGPVALGESLLSQARERNEENRRRRDKNAERMLLATLGGKLVGGILNKAYEKKLNNFMASEAQLSRNALVRGVSADNQAVLDTQKAIQGHTGGIEGYMFDRDKQAVLEMYKRSPNYTGIESDRALDDLAGRVARSMNEESINNFKNRLQYAQQFQDLSGDDPTAFDAYIANVQKAAGAEEKGLGRLFRTATSFFSGPDDKNIDKAIHNNVIASKIYKNSEAYRANFDETYRATGSARVSAALTEELAKIGKLPDKPNKIRAANYNVRDPVTGKMVSESGFIATDPSGNDIGYLDADGMPVSVETMQGRRQGVTQMLTTTEANSRMGGVMNLMTEDDQNDVRSRVMALAGGTSTKPATAAQRESAAAVFASKMAAQSNLLSQFFGDAAEYNGSRIDTIAAHALVLDAEAFDGKAVLTSNPAKVHPIVHYAAAVKSYGSEDQIPSPVKQRMDMVLTEALNDTLQNPEISLLRLHELKNFVEENTSRGGFGSFYGFKYGDMDVDDVLEQAIATRTAE